MPYSGSWTRQLVQFQSHFDCFITAEVGSRAAAQWFVYALQFSDRATGQIIQKVLAFIKKAMHIDWFRELSLDNLARSAVWLLGFDWPRSDAKNHDTRLYSAMRNVIKFHFEEELK